MKMKTFRGLATALGLGAAAMAGPNIADAAIDKESEPIAETQLDQNELREQIKVFIADVDALARDCADAINEMPFDDRASMRDTHENSYIRSLARARTILQNEEKRSNSSNVHVSALVQSTLTHGQEVIQKLVELRYSEVRRIRQRAEEFLPEHGVIGLTLDPGDRKVLLEILDPKDAEMVLLSGQHIPRAMYLSGSAQAINRLGAKIEKAVTGPLVDKIREVERLMQEQPGGGSSPEKKIAYITDYRLPCASYTFVKGVGFGATRFVHSSSHGITLRFGQALVQRSTLLS